MLAAAVVTIDLHGKSTAEELLPVFEDFLENAPADRKYDDARQSVVVLMGSLAKHLDPNDPKVSHIIENPRLLGHLKKKSSNRGVLIFLLVLNIFWPFKKKLSNRETSAGHALKIFAGRPQIGCGNVYF
jgi:hypothetical protein